MMGAATERRLGVVPSRAADAELAQGYVNAGLVLVPIPSGEKGPITIGWNTREKCISDAGKAARLTGGNLGLAHVYSTPPTGALDIDDYELATQWLAARGINLIALLAADDAVQIRSGKPNRAKLVYRLPHALQTVQLHDSGIEFRCASETGLTLQDVLPPSVHPDTGKPYEWGGMGDWRQIPDIPQPLLALWSSLATTPAKAGRSTKVAEVQSTDPVIVKLAERGDVLRYRADGGVDIRCPFEPEHTGDNRGSSTTYFARNTGGFANGHFECLHHHCKQRADEEFLRAIGMQVQRAVQAEEQIIVPGSNGPQIVALNEDNVAVVFASQYRGKLLFDHDRGRWHRWDGSRWRPDSTDLALHYSRELCRDLNKEGRKQFAKAATFAAVERIARADRVFAVTSEKWDSDPLLLATPGGTVNLRTGELRPASPGDHITKLTAVAPNASEPALWLGFLEEATQGDAEMVNFLQRFAGYSLCGSTAEECLVFAYGPGGNGKGVFIGTLTSAWGEYATTAAMDTFLASKFERHPTDLAMLAGARLVVASETTEGKDWDEGRIKALTGGDSITARFMRRDNFTYRPQFKLLLIGNHKPSLRTVDEAARRRFHIVPFLNAPAERDPTLKERLRHELGAILGWAIQGCLMWQQGGLQVPQRVREETEAYFSAQDVFGSWLEECTERRSSDSWELHSSLFRSWSEFADANHEAVGSAKSFTERLESRGFARSRHTGGVRGFRGIRFKSGGSDRK